MTQSVPLLDLGVVAELGHTAKSLSFTPEGMQVAGPRHLFPGMHYWRLLLTFADADDPSYLVIGGYADILTVRPEEPDLDDRLSLALAEIDYSAKAEAFAALVSDPRQFNAVLKRAHAAGNPGLLALGLDAFVDPCFRGHNFGLLLLWQLYDFLRVLIDGDDVRAPVIVGHISEGTPDELVEHWKTELNATLVDTGLIVLPEEIIPLSPQELIAESKAAGYIKVDADTLRQRLADGDATLSPTSDGRRLDVDADADAEGDDEARADVAGLQANDAVGIAVQTGVYDPDVEVEIVTALRFLACTAADGDGTAEPFAGAVDYLVAHPEVSVVATNWSTGPCESGGEHLILEVTVRQGVGNSA